MSKIWDAITGFFSRIFGKKKPPQPPVTTDDPAMLDSDTAVGAAAM